LVFIHPFLNGNGRFSRLVSDRFLKAWKFSCPRWPVDLGNDGQHRRITSGKRLELLVKACIRCGCSVTDLENNGHFPLQISINQGLENIAQLLLDNGRRCEERDRSGLSAFECALTLGMYKIAYEMYKRGCPYIPRQPNVHLKAPHQNLDKFDQLYF